MDRVMPGGSAVAPFAKSLLFLDKSRLHFLFCAIANRVNMPLIPINSSLVLRGLRAAHKPAT